MWERCQHGSGEEGTGIKKKRKEAKTRVMDSVVFLGNEVVVV